MVNTELTDDCDEYQSPMFLMKYFVAVAAHDTGYGDMDLAFLNVAPYLELTKIIFLAELIGITPEDVAEYIATRDHQFTLSNIRIAHPHLPESYVYLTSVVSSTSFSAN